MTPFFVRALVTFSFLFAVNANAQSTQSLEFDAKRNGVELYGPYIKYNFLKKPFSFGQHFMDPSDVRVEFRNGPEFETKDGKKPTAEGAPYLYAVWPKFFAAFGKVTLFDLSDRVLVEEAFTDSNTYANKKYRVFRFDQADINGREESLAGGVYLCIKQQLPTTFIRLCSDKIKLPQGKKQFVPLAKTGDVKVLMNGKKVPRNAQVNLPEKDRNVELFVQFDSGFKIFIKDVIRRVSIDNVAIDIRNKRIGISGGGAIVKAKPSFKDKVFYYLQEKNYYQDQFAETTEWPADITDADMEFSPFPLGAGAQLYGVSFNEIPPKDFGLKLSKKSPIATYSSTVEIFGLKKPDETIKASRKKGVLISKDKKAILWKFPAPKKGLINKDYIVYNHEGTDYYFSRRIYRGYQSSVSLAPALSTSLELDIVFGTQIYADFWPEKLFGRHWASFQRWGFGFGYYQTLQDFEVPKKGTSTNVKAGLEQYYLDVYYRFTPGVRPVTSTFGAGLRYYSPTVTIPGVSISPQLIGIGSFWHTAPQKIVDDVFNMAPFFRYPKWMEVGFFLYPLNFNSAASTKGIAFTWWAKGRLFFSKVWFFEASINVNNLPVQKKVGTRVTTANSPTAFGTLGFGYQW